MKKVDYTTAAPNEGEVDLTKVQVENVVEPNQGSTNPQSLDNTATSDEEAADATGEQVTANTEATDGGDAAAPTAIESDEATTDTTESNDAVQGGENTSAGQDPQAQATGAGPEESKSGKKSAGKKAASVPKNTKPAPDYSLNYSDEKKKELERVTRVGDAEIKRVLNDSHFHAIPNDDSSNAFINLTKAAMDGVSFKTPEVNRKHGKDETSTGESLMKHYPHHPFIVITEKMAEAAGIKVKRFSNDDPTKPFNGSGYTLIILDGNGRCNFLLGLEGGPKEWPDVYAIFPPKNRAGYYDIPKSLEVMNTKVTVWKTSDYLIKRILEEGVKSHKGWKAINQLVQKGYNYQAACELMTLRSDRITQNEITSGDAKRIFLHFDSAVKIHKSLVKRFCEGDKDKTLKTKAFPAKVSELWLDLQAKKGDAPATDYMIEFINQFPQDKVKEIWDAKGYKGDDGAKVTKDAVRIGILETQFNEYLKQHPFDTED